ncbi:MAG TPA: hypothetical protein VN766_10880 [Stellaceae bacterium]|nr:hypothetical protein [Stellaceae bacterium]
MTHAQLLYLILVVAAFVIFTGSLLMATVLTVSRSNPDGDSAGERPAGPRSSNHSS